MTDGRFTGRLYTSRLRGCLRLSSPRHWRPCWSFVFPGELEAPSSTWSRPLVYSNVNWVCGERGQCVTSAGGRREDCGVKKSGGGRPSTAGPRPVVALVHHRTYKPASDAGWPALHLILCLDLQRVYSNLRTRRV